MTRRWIHHSQQRRPGGLPAPILGQSTQDRRPSYRVRSGEYLVMRIGVVVPEHVRITALWFGVSTGAWGTGLHGRPTGMHPILAHYAHPLPAGSHTFGLRWRIPRLHAKASRMLTFAWSSSQPPASVMGPFAHLVVN